MKHWWLKRSAGRRAAQVLNCFLEKSWFCAAFTRVCVFMLCCVSCSVKCVLSSCLAWLMCCSPSVSYLSGWAGSSALVLCGGNVVFSSVSSHWVKCVFRASVHLDSPVRAGGEPRSVAAGCQSVSGQRHVLFILRHGALHQGVGPADRIPQGTRFSLKCQSFASFPSWEKLWSHFWLDFMLYLRQWQKVIVGGLVCECSVFRRCDCVINVCSELVKERPSVPPGEPVL